MSNTRGPSHLNYLLKLVQDHQSDGKFLNAAAALQEYERERAIYIASLQHKGLKIDESLLDDVKNYTEAPNKKENFKKFIDNKSPESKPSMENFKKFTDELNTCVNEGDFSTAVNALAQYKKNLEEYKREIQRRIEKNNRIINGLE